MLGNSAAMISWSAVRHLIGSYFGGGDEPEDAVFAVGKSASRAFNRPQTSLPNSSSTSGTCTLLILPDLSTVGILSRLLRIGSVVIFRRSADEADDAAHCTEFDKKVDGSVGR